SRAQVDPGRFGAHLERELALAGIEIGAQHATAVGAEERHGDLSYEPETDDEDGVAQSHAGEPYGIEGDGAEDPVRGLVRRDRGGDVSHEMLRDADDARMRPVRGDAIPGLEGTDALPDCENDARRRLSQADGLIQFAADLGDRAEETFVAEFL